MHSDPLGIHARRRHRQNERIDVPQNRADPVGSLVERRVHDDGIPFRPERREDLGQLVRFPNLCGIDRRRSYGEHTNLVGRGASNGGARRCPEEDHVDEPLIGLVLERLREERARHIGIDEEDLAACVGERAHDAREDDAGARAIPERRDAEHALVANRGDDRARVPRAPRDEVARARLAVGGKVGRPCIAARLKRQASEVAETRVWPHIRRRAHRTPPRERAGCVRAVD
jgi:hypothetical protein